LGASSLFGNRNVTDDDHILAVLINTLRFLNNHVCEKAADKLEKRVHSFNSYTLHLRYGMLDSLDAKKISEALKSVHQNHNIRLTSFSVSYNTNLGHEGVLMLIKNLPKTITELGLVQSGISDKSAEALINWTTNAKQLRWLCVEKNTFSDTIKDRFRKLGQERSDLLVDF
jgi:hypothetical protein